MTTTRFATAFIKADDLDRFKRYLYDAHTVVSAQEYAYPDGRKVALVVVKTETTQDVEWLQQYQADRLASGMLPLIIGYKTFQAASEYLLGQAKANDLEPCMSIHDVEFDSVFEVHADGTLTHRYDLYAPAVTHDDERDVDVDNSCWTPLVGWTGQYGYNGAVLHASEQFAGALADYVTSHPDVYVLTVVEVLADDPDANENPEPAGWAILRYCGVDVE